MAITRNEIYNYIEGKVNTTARPVYCSTRLEPVAETFPALYLAETSKREPFKYVTLQFDGGVVEVTWEAQVFSNDSDDGVQECHTIMDDVASAFRDLKFTMTFCSEIPNNDPSVYRMVARFYRVYGGGNKIPTT